MGRAGGHANGASQSLHHGDPRARADSGCRIRRLVDHLGARLRCERFPKRFSMWGATGVTLGRTGLRRRQQSGVAERHRRFSEGFDENFSWRGWAAAVIRHLTGQSADCGVAELPVGMPLVQTAGLDLIHNIGAVNTAGFQHHAFCREVLKQRTSSLVDHGHVAQVEKDRLSF